MKKIPYLKFAAIWAGIGAGIVALAEKQARDQAREARRRRWTDANRWDRD